VGSAKSIPESLAEASAAEKRVILSMGGKGGVGTMPPTGLCRVDSSFLKSNGSTHVFEAA
jgi:hypothetical protein